MIITFNELRRIKDKLPSGSSQRIADELGIDVETVRNYFGGKHLDAKAGAGIHIEQGPDGGVVTLDDTTIFHGFCPDIGADPTTSSTGRICRYNRKAHAWPWAPAAAA